MVDKKLCAKCKCSAPTYWGELCCDYIGHFGRMRPRGGKGCAGFQKDDGEVRPLGIIGHTDISYGTVIPWRKEEK